MLVKPILIRGYRLLWAHDDRALNSSAGMAELEAELGCWAEAALGNAVEGALGPESVSNHDSDKLSLWPVSEGNLEDRKHAF